MSVTVTKESENLIVIGVNGLLTFNDQKSAENRVGQEIGGTKKVKLLVLAEMFSGWGEEGNWGDMTFINENDPYIDKMAVVASEKWREQMLMFVGAGIRQAKVEFFPTGDEEKAREWLYGED